MSRYGKNADDELERQEADFRAGQQPPFAPDVAEAAAPWSTPDGCDHWGPGLCSHCCPCEACGAERALAYDDDLDAMAESREDDRWIARQKRESR